MSMPNTNEIRFRIRSTNPSVSAAELVTALSGEIKDLEAQLRKEKDYETITVEADRQKSVPIDPHTAWLVIKFIGEAVAGGILKKLTEEAFDFIKGRIHNGTVTKDDRS